MVVTAAADSSAPRPALPRRLWIGLALLGAFRLWMAAVIPLTEDEAYYRLWAASPQFGYFDHPPMIAWWIAAGRALLGDTPLGVRLVPVLASLAASLLAFDLAAQLGAGARTAERAAWWTAATLLIGAGCVLAVPDAATTPFWMATLCCLARAKDRPGWWLAAGLAAGLACLSKYSALFLAPGALIWLTVDPVRRRRLATPGPWLTLVVAAAVFSLNIAWNAQHHWLTFDKQFGRVAPGRLSPGYELELILGQALLLNPLITVFALRALRLRPAPGRPDLSLVWAATAAFAGYLLLHALHDRVQAHWPVVLYPGLALAAAIAADDGAWGERGRGALKMVRALAAPVGLGLCALALLHLALPQTDLPHGRDPAGPVRGWPAFAAEVEAVRHGGGEAWVGTLSYGVTGQLAAQPALGAPVIELTERERYPAADASWRADLSRPGLVVDLQRRAGAAALARCFGAVRDLGPLARDGGGRGELYELLAVANPIATTAATGCAALAPVQPSKVQSAPRDLAAGAGH